MSKKYEVTVGKTTYAVTELQAHALTNAEFRFTLDGLYTQRQGRSKRPYIGHLAAGSKRSLHQMGLLERDWGRFAEVTATGRRVAKKLWPLFYDKSIEEMVRERAADDAERERERKRKAKVAVKAFTGIKDAQGKSVARRLRDEHVLTGEWHYSLKLDLDDLAVIGEQLLEMRS
jgi:hypothetical protein